MFARARIVKFLDLSFCSVSVYQFVLFWANLWDLFRNLCFFVRNDARAVYPGPPLDLHISKNIRGGNIRRRDSSGCIYGSWPI